MCLNFIWFDSRTHKRLYDDGLRRETKHLCHKHKIVIRPTEQRRRVALSCAPVRAFLCTHGLESTLVQRCAHGSAPVGALPWAQHALCASDWLNFVLICNIADGLLKYAKVFAYLATHSQTNTYQSPQNRWHSCHSSSHPPPARAAQASYRLPCRITILHGRRYDACAGGGWDDECHRFCGDW